MDSSEEQIENEIKHIFNENKIKDLKKFISKRNCLNVSNQIMNYLFHIIQSAGVLTTTIAAGYDMKQLVWIGVGLNILASLINVFEKTNDAISKRLLKDIHAIKNGTYVDEGMMIEDAGAKHMDKHDKKNDNNSESVDLVEKGFVQQNPQDKNERIKQVLKSPLISEGEK